MFGRFFYILANKYRNFMFGRYGTDEFGMFLVILSVMLTLVARASGVWYINTVSTIVILYALYRMCSRNIAKRYQEKMKFIKIKNDITSRLSTLQEAWRNRKTHKYFRCKKCKTSIRVPKGVGKIEVSCPVCRFKTIKKV